MQFAFKGHLWIEIYLLKDFYWDSHASVGIIALNLSNAVVLCLVADVTALIRGCLNVRKGPIIEVNKSGPMERTYILRMDLTLMRHQLPIKP